MSRVSVIIPAYNRARMLRQAIQSVLAQTYRDFEVIVVDDGSTDDTREMVASIPDPRIHYIWQENQERSAARNNGARQANGELLAFLDSDDVWLPNKLAVQVELMDRYPAVVLLYGSYVRMDDQNGLLTPLDLLNQSEEVETKDTVAGETLPALSCPVTVLLRRKAFEDVGGFDPRLSFSEDWDLWIRVSELGPSCSVRSPVAAVRVHASNSINDVAGSLSGGLTVIEKTSARRGAAFDQRSKTKAELDLYVSHTALAVDRDMPEATHWMVATLARSAIVNGEGAIRRAFLGYITAGGCSLRDCRARARGLETLVRLINSLGGSESRRVWLGSFWGAAIHSARAMGDNHLAGQAFLHLLACGGIGVVDRGVVSGAVRAVLALARHPSAKRKPLPREREISVILEELRNAGNGGA